MKKFFKILYYIFLYFFAGVGLVFTAIFFGMRFGIFNVRGSIADRNQFFTGAAPVGTSSTTVPPCTDSEPVCDWPGTPEWGAISGGLTKDADIINKVATQTGVSPRMIAAVVIPEQTRFFTSNRDIFKSYFEPLKILGSLTQFSLGVSGIKQDTAVAIEKNASDPTSAFYPGANEASLFAYAPTDNHDEELYNRLTDSKDHYYQYLYTALFIKEIEAQWASAGYDVTQKPEVIVTLFNLGFQASSPKANPQVGGAPITTGGKTYLYGELGSDFFHSEQMSTVFPQ